MNRTEAIRVLPDLLEEAKYLYTDANKPMNVDEFFQHEETVVKYVVSLLKNTREIDCPSCGIRHFDHVKIKMIKSYSENCSMCKGKGKIKAIILED